MCRSMHSPQRRKDDELSGNDDTKMQRTNSTTAEGSKARSKQRRNRQRRSPMRPPKATKMKVDQGAAARSGCKTAIVLELMRRKEGATLPEMAKATDRQNHSIRGPYTCSQQDAG